MLSVEYVPIDELVPYASNARTHSDAQVAQIAASMLEFGWTNPVLVDADGGIIAGHGRVLAALRVGIDPVPCIRLAHLSDTQRRALVLADNKLALNAGWDESLLSLELQALADDGFDLGLTGFGVDELADLLADRTAGLTDPDEAPPCPINPVSVAGDVWLLGRHRLVCGDSTDADVVARCLNGQKPNLMVTDPPYGVDYDANWRNEAARSGATFGRKRGVIGGRAIGKVQNDDRADWREAWSLFPGSVAYVWHGGLHAAEVAESLIACRLKPRAQIVWVKTNFVIGRGAYHWQHEPCLYAVAEGAQDDGWADRFEPDHETAVYAVKDGQTAKWRGGRKQSTVWFIEHVKSETGHSTQKPVEAMRRPIENNSVPGQWVYEPFSGSGTTIIAGEMTGRCVAAIELDPAYVDVAVKRWQAFTGQAAVLDGDGRSFEDVCETRYALESGRDSAGSYDEAVSAARLRLEAASGA